MTKFLITGANGFVGRTLCGEAVSRGFRVRGTTRAICDLGTGVENAAVGAIDGSTNWMTALCDVETIIHLAARVHVMRDEMKNPLETFRKVNVAGTENLARQGVEAGVRRFVYVSSIKVLGEKTTDDCCFTEGDAACPQDPYAISKWEAEQALHRVAQETGLEVVIVRPPLVYGAGAKGNFAQMIKVLSKGVPLPLASVRNLRSLIYVDNLIDALICCATHPTAAGQTYLVSDGEDVSTPELLRLLGNAIGRPARPFSCPLPLLKLAGRLLRRADQIERLTGSLRMDSGKLCRDLDWHPPVTLQEGLRRAVAGIYE